MEEKEIRDLGKRESGEKYPVFPKENTPDRQEERIAEPAAEEDAESFRTDADNAADPISENMPDSREKSVSAPYQEETSSVFGVPDFVRAADSAPDGQTDTGTLLLSEIRETDPPGRTDEEDMTVDPNATTLNSPLDNTDLSDSSLPEKDHRSGNRKKNGKCSFDPGTVFAPGGNLDAISLLETDTEESAFSAFPDIQTDRKKLISELAFEQETSEDGSAFNLDASDIFAPPREPDFDFVRSEKESPDKPAEAEQPSAGFQTDADKPESAWADIPEEQTRSIPSSGEMPSSDSDRNLIHQFLSETVKDKSGPENKEAENEKEEDVHSLGAAFITEIHDEETADPDALTIMMSPAEFENAGLKVDRKTAENKSADAHAPAEKDGNTPFDLSEILPEQKPEQIPEEKEEDKPFDLSEILPEQKSEPLSVIHALKEENVPFDLSEILPEPGNKPVSDSEVKTGKNTASEKFLSEQGDESVFDLNAPNLLEPDAVLEKPEKEELPDPADSEDESVFDLNAQNIFETDAVLEKPEKEELPDTADSEDESVFDLNAQNIFEPDAVLEKPEKEELPDPADSEDESVFDLNAQNIFEPDAVLEKPDIRESGDSPVPEPGTDFSLSSFLESPEAEDEPIFDLGAEAMVEAEDEMPVKSKSSITENEEENFDADAETVVASAADILGLTSENLLEPPSETDTAGDEEMDELLIRDADEGLPDLDSILDAAKKDQAADHKKDVRASEKTENISQEAGLSAMDILESMGSPETGNRGGDNAAEMLNMPDAEAAAQSPEEDDFFHVPDVEEDPEPVKKISKPLAPRRMTVKTDKKENRIQRSVLSEKKLEENREIQYRKHTGYRAEHEPENEPLYDTLSGKYYFSLSPVQIEASIERIVNRIFSDRIENMIKKVVAKAVEEEMKKFRDGIIEDIAEGDKL